MVLLVGARSVVLLLVVLLTGVDEDGVHVELCADGAQDEATGWTKHQSGEEDSCKK